MEMRTVAVILSYVALSYVYCCKKNERLIRCGVDRVINEKVCDDVKKTTCNQYTLQCACARGMTRHTKHGCVPEGNCGKSPQQIQRETRQREERLNKIYESALEVMKSYNELHLVMMPMETWLDSICVCMKCTFSARADESNIRTMHCYYVPEILVGGNVRQKVSGGNAMQRVEQYIDFFVKKRDGRVKLELVPLYGESPRLAFGLKYSYEIIFAEDTCIVIATGEHSSGKPHCMLWGLVSAEHKEEHGCFTEIYTKCHSDYFHVWDHNNRCTVHDQLLNRERERLEHGLT